VVSPNPFSEAFTLFGISSGSWIIVHDMTGREMLRERITSNINSLNGSAWPAGMYSAQIRGERPMNIRLVKQ